MEKGLKGFKDYRDYLSYAQVCLSWRDDNDHQKLYEMLLKRKGEIEPLSYMRQMSLLTHSQIKQKASNESPKSCRLVNSERSWGESVDHKQKKDLQKKTERKRDNKDKKQSEKTQELEESKGTRVIRPLWFAVVGFILSMAALFSWFFFR